MKRENPRPIVGTHVDSNKYSGLKICPKGATGNSEIPTVMASSPNATNGNGCHSYSRYSDCSDWMQSRNVSCH